MNVTYPSISTSISPLAAFDADLARLFPARCLDTDLALSMARVASIPTRANDDYMAAMVLSLDTSNLAGMGAWF